MQPGGGRCALSEGMDIRLSEKEAFGVDVPRPNGGRRVEHDGPAPVGDTVRVPQGDVEGGIADHGGRTAPACRVQATQPRDPSSAPNPTSGVAIRPDVRRRPPAGTPEARPPTWVFKYPRRRHPQPPLAQRVPAGDLFGRQRRCGGPRHLPGDPIVKRMRGVVHRRAVAAAVGERAAPPLLHALDDERILGENVLPHPGNACSHRSRRHARKPDWHCIARLKGVAGEPRPELS